jgi:hypothetical protein
MQRSNHLRRPPRKVLVASLSGLLLLGGQSCGKASAPAPSDGPPARMACDGRTNDTAALNALLQSGQEVSLPAGECIVDGAAFDGGAVHLEGSASGRTTLKLPAGSPRDILRLTNLTGSVSNLDFDQRGATGDSVGLRVNNAKGLRVSGLRILNPNNVGALFHGCVGCTLDGLTSPGGGTHGAWIVEFLEGRDNVVRNISSVNAVNRTLVMELETGADVENISSRDGVAETVLFDRTSHSTGRNWSYVDTKGNGRDDAFALIGTSERNRIENVTADRPAGFGFTFAAQTTPQAGAPRFNEVYNLKVSRPGQQILSFTDDGGKIGPYCNVVSNLLGIDPNQQQGGNFPAIDFFGARNNAVFGSLRSSDRRMTWGVVEVDHVAGAGDNMYFGSTETGSKGRFRLAARESSRFRAGAADPEGMKNPRLRMPCLREG